MRRRALLTLTGSLLAACDRARVMNDGGDGRGRVILLRGLINIFSGGMDALGDRVAAAGYTTEVHNHTSWRELAERCVQDARAGRLPRPLAVIGHSLGADSAISLVGLAGSLGVAADLLVTFDAAWVNTVPRGPRYVLNFHTTLDPPAAELTPEPGFDGVIENVPLGPRFDHFSLDDSPVLHARVVARLNDISAAERLATLPAAGPPRPVTIAPVSAPEPVRRRPRRDGRSQA